MDDQTTKINWEARHAAISAAKAGWLDKYSHQLKLIQYTLVRAYDEHSESTAPDRDKTFVMDTEDAINSLASIISDLRGQDFIAQAKAKNPEAF